MTATDAETTYDRTSGPIHEWFELTYSSHQVLPRVLMQSMPVEWQRRMVACLEEMRAAFAHRPDLADVEYKVEPVEWMEPGELTTVQRNALGISIDWREDDAPEQGPTYYSARGDELDSQRACVPVPVPDRLPGYRHGFVAPYGGESR